MNEHNEKPRALPRTKRCAMCKLTRGEGVVIGYGQGYCKDCMKIYKQRLKARKKKEVEQRAE